MANYLGRPNRTNKKKQGASINGFNRAVAPSVLFLITDIAHPFAFQGLGTIDDSGNRAYAISADGSTIVGVADSASGGYAFRWTDAGGIQGLGIADGTVDHASGVSGNGSTTVGDGSTGAFYWTSAAGAQFPGFYAASDISQDGTVIVGTANNAPGGQPVYWTVASGTVVLPAVAGAPQVGQALGISLDGKVIVGAIATGIDGGTTIAQAAAWVDGGSPIILGAGPTSTAHAASMQ